MAETKTDALAAFDAFVETWSVKYDKAVECLIKDRDALLGFYDFLAEHWTNVIESSFATVRHRTVRSKGCLSNRTALAMIFKLAKVAEKSWRRLIGHNRLLFTADQRLEPVRGRHVRTLGGYHPVPPGA